jgi:hypothetical protein
MLLYFMHVSRTMPDGVHGDVQKLAYPHNGMAMGEQSAPRTYASQVDSCKIVKLQDDVKSVPSVPGEGQA